MKPWTYGWQKRQQIHKKRITAKIPQGLQTKRQEGAASWIMYLLSAKPVVFSYWVLMRLP